MSTESQANDIIAKEITIAVVQSMEICKYLEPKDIPGYVTELYKTILQTVNNP